MKRYFKTLLGSNNAFLFRPHSFNTTEIYATDHFGQYARLNVVKLSDNTPRNFYAFLYLYTRIRNFIFYNQNTVKNVFL